MGTKTANAPRPTPYTANRRIGNMRTLYSQYFAFTGEEDRANPLRKLSFKDNDKNKRKRPPYSIKWIRNKILRPGALEGLNAEARSIFLAIIETRDTHILDAPRWAVSLHRELVNSTR